MWGSRRQLREVVAALDAAQSFAEWHEAALAHDRLTGADAWRAEDDSPYYDASTLEASIASLVALRASGDRFGLAGALTRDLYRHLNDLSAPGLYQVALGGTKHLVERYLDEADGALRWLASEPIPGIPPAEVLRRFEEARRVFGRTALLLSGGATLGFHHLGVVKALFELDLLPDLLSGASTGAMIASGVCARTDPELAALLAEPASMRLDGLRSLGWRAAARAGAWLDQAHLYEVLQNNIGGYTFAEAHARTGRTLTISVSPTRTRQKPRLLTHLTAPDVLVASAALASSALPGLYPPVILDERGADGVVSPYLAGERWVDGSIHGDLPMQRLARLHNVNHFVVSQTNPHVLPFVGEAGRRGLGSTVSEIAGTAVRSQGVWAAGLARQLSRVASGPIETMSERMHALVTQDYRGDIDIHPRLRPSLYRKVFSNPTPEDLDGFVAEGQRAVWPKVAMIRAQTRIGWAFRDCVRQLRAACGA